MIYLENEFRLKFANYNNIEKCKHFPLIIKNPSSSLIRFPGIIFPNKNIMNKYIDRFGKIYFKEFTPPRGNFSGSVAIIGQAPGKKYKYLSQSESAWLLGPSSRILHKALMQFDIFPYFTNVYKNAEDLNIDISNYWINCLVNELELFSSGKNSVKLIFLGKYDVYDKVKNKLDKDNIKCYCIYHPSYILRKQSMFNKWIQQFINIFGDN